MGALLFLPELGIGTTVQLSSPQGERLVGTGVTAPGISSGTPVALFVDPQNISTFALDSNTGANATNVPPGTGPIRTTAENNRRIVSLGRLSIPPANIQYLSDDNSGTQALVPPGEPPVSTIQFTGTPQVLATTTVTAVAAINPATSQREQITTALADLTPFVLNGYFGGGTSAFPCFFRVVGGARAGNTAWIVNTTAGEGGSTAKANCTRPVDPTFVVSAAINVGDTVQICRGSNLSLAPVMPGFVGAFFMTFAFFRILNTITGDAQNENVTFQACSFDGANMGCPSVAFSCATWNGAVLVGAGLNLPAGFYAPTAFDAGLFLILSGDCYMAPVASGIIAGPFNWNTLTIEAGIGSGAQWWTQGTGLATDAGLTCLTSQIVGAAQPGLAHTLIWGTCPAVSGILIGQGATLTVSGAAGFHPTLVGSAQAYAWLQQGISGVVTTRNQGETASTTAYSGPFSTITWGSLFNAANFNGQAHNIQTNAHVIAYQG